jgi:hypothetical protein
MPAPGAGVTLKTNERDGIERRYLRVTSGPQRGKYLHTIVAEAKIGRALTADETVDHIDGDTLNNHWTNLQVLTLTEHAKKSAQQKVAWNEKRRRERHAKTAHGENGSDVVPF